MADEDLNLGGVQMKDIGDTPIHAYAAIFEYDTYPPALRKVMQDMPLNCHVTTEGLECAPFEIEDLLHELCAESTMDTYGPSHPQAKRYTPLRRQKVY